MWEWVLSFRYVGLRDRAQVIIRHFQLSHLAQTQPFSRQGLGPGLHQTQCAACPLLPAGVPVTGGRRTGWNSLQASILKAPGMSCGVWSLVLRRLASVCSTRMACMGCTRMYIISTPSTRCRACRCCSARLECAQVRRGQGTVRVSGPSLTPPSPG